MSKACPRCGRPMVESLAFVCFGGGHGAKLPTGWDCVNTECIEARRREQDECDDRAIRNAIEKGVIDP